MTLSTPTTDHGYTRPVPRRRRRGRTVLGAVTVVLLGSGAVAGWAWWNGSIGGVPVRPHCTATALGTTAELDPDQAANAATIAAVAIRRKLPGRAATIAIATAMQESKLVNLPGGDLDSIGLFQQRPSQGWGTAAQVHDPVYATNAFYDVLVKIEGYQSLPITASAQKVQRSAFPSAYAEHEPEARIWASVLTGYSPAGLSCVLGTVSRSAAQAPGPGGLTLRAHTLVTAATAALGRTGTALAGSGGSAIRFTISGKDGQSAWGVAQWAVASADALGIVAVEIDGRQWQRSDSTAGWTARGAGPAAGTVVVRVAP
jgi:hypothetical protein